jgi:ribosomal protein L11 methyltransferase
MFSIFLRCALDEEDWLTAELWERNTAGLADEPGGLRAFFEDDAGAPEMLQRFARFRPELRIEAETDWAQVSRDAWPTMLVGERFFLVPPWREDPAPAGRMRLEIDPGMACGTGRHPATQLCLEAMERYVQPGSTVVDVGTGSGILSAAARLLGAARVVACDIDAEAVEIARRRVRAAFFVGTIDAVESDVADIVIANINSETIERLRPEFERVRRPGGVLILSGFPEWDAVEGFKVMETLRRDEWVCVVCGVNVDRTACCVKR